MARDYKNRRHEKATRHLPGWVWLLSGLAIGLFVALLVYLNEHPAKAPTGIPTVSVDSARDTREVKTQKDDPIPPPAKPRFDFYTVLPELEVVIPEGQYEPKEPAGTSNSNDGKPVEDEGQYLLQAGSFRKYEEADRLKASLALLGVQAHIQKVQINSDTWHRVRIGPYTRLAELNTVREKLRKNGVDTIPMKVRE